LSRAEGWLEKAGLKKALDGGALTPYKT